MSGLEMVPSFRLVRSADGEEGAGRVERTELWRSLAALLAWSPDIDLAPLSAVRSLIAGDAISLARLDALTTFIDDALSHYIRANSRSTHPLVVDSTARALVDFEYARDLLRAAMETMKGWPQRARW